MAARASELAAFYPLTNSGHIFLADMLELVPGMKAVLEKLNSRAGTVGPPIPVGGDIKEALQYLELAVDGPFPSRFLFLPAKASRTVLFNNSWRSQGWFEMAFMATSMLDVEDVFFRAQPNTIRKNGTELRGQYGALQLIRMVSGKIARSISLVNDGGRWVFSTEGEPGRFEDLSQYQAAKKTERFTQSILEQCLQAMDLYPFREDFYAIDAHRQAIGIEIEMTQPLAIERLQMSRLGDVQTKYGPFN